MIKAMEERHNLKQFHQVGNSTYIYPLTFNHKLNLCPWLQHVHSLTFKHN